MVTASKSDFTDYRELDGCERAFLFFLFALVTYLLYETVPVFADWIVGSIKDLYADWISYPHGYRVAFGVPGLVLAVYLAGRFGYQLIDGIGQREIQREAAEKKLRDQVELLECDLASRERAIEMLREKNERLKGMIEELRKPGPVSAPVEDPTVALEKISQELIHE